MSGNITSETIGVVSFTFLVPIDIPKNIKSYNLVRMV